MTPTAQPNATGPIVQTQMGSVQGTTEDGMHTFKGIPYAAPPVGDLRWANPQPHAAWEGVRDASEFGASCIQPQAKIEGAGAVGAHSEDCLYLNVWTPNPEPNAKLPVMVWIHGGALLIGSGSLPLYDGTPLAERGAVVVTFNYRLGQLGFFSHPALDKEDPNGTVNFGLMDEIEALKWVQQNIASFGGDPNNVTIFGESAGGQSVLALFASPLAKGLFQRGISESPYGIPSHTRTKALEAGVQVADALGLDGATATLAELRAVPAGKFSSLNQKGMTLAPSFVAGDPALPQPILDTFQKNQEAALPLIIGSNSNEATVVEAFGIDPAQVIERLGIADLALKRLYPGVTDNEQLGREVIRDLIFTSFVKRMADLHAAVAPSWRYYFSYLLQAEQGKLPGVPHGGELPFVFGTGDTALQTKAIWTPQDQTMADRVGDYWFTFAKTGQPDPVNEPAWTQAGPNSDGTMEFGNTIALQTNMMRTRLNVFIGVFSLLGRILNR